MTKISNTRYALSMMALSLFTCVCGYIACVQPSGAGFRFFSYHPLLMTVAFVGFMGGAAVTKKLGGYTNTKLHGIMGSTGLSLAYGGLYVIYRNKEMAGKEHITSPHALGGVCVLVGVTVVGIAGGSLLHPDFGLAKTNKLFRLAHLWSGRILLSLAWFTCFSGLNQLTQDIKILAMYGLPLMLLFPFVLM